MDSIISVANVTKTFKIPHLKTYIVHLRKTSKYDMLYALKNITLSIRQGEFIGLIGRNGSGKSTQLKVIAGIIHPNAGAVEVNGRISPFLELGVGFNPELTAKDNIFLYSSILGLSKNLTKRRMDTILDFSELHELNDSPLKTFSSGMQVRSDFAAAIQSDAAIILVDEVLAVGVISFQKKCFAEFSRFKQDGRTVVYVSYNLETVSKYCDRVYYLKRGEELLSGAPNDMTSLCLNEN